MIGDTVTKKSPFCQGRVEAVRHLERILLCAERARNRLNLKPQPCFYTSACRARLRRKAHRERRQT